MRNISRSFVMVNDDQNIKGFSRVTYIRQGMDLITSLPRGGETS